MKCFDNCITKPGSSLSGGEGSCISRCVDMTRPYTLLSTVVNSPSKAAAESPEEFLLKPDSIVILAILLCAIPCIICLIHVARRAWLMIRRRSLENSLPGQQSANQGIKKKVLDSLPKFNYDSDKEENGVNSGDCAICLAEYAGGDEIRVLPQCGHGFHVGCIKKWLGSHSSCPWCRQIVVIGQD